MRVVKKVLDSLDKCYAVALADLDGALRFLVATEGPGPCYSYDGAGGRETVWEGPGGTMNIVPLPGAPGEFLATQDFTPTFQAKESKVVRVFREDGAWRTEHLITVPYLHRFDVHAAGGRRWFVGATLCLFKESKEDWSKPGAVYVGELPERLEGPFPIRPVLSGITRNHGFCKASWRGRPAYLVSGAEGVFALYPPAPGGGGSGPEDLSLGLAGGGTGWACERVLEGEVSDIAVCHGLAGATHLAAIRPFHGSRGVLYREREGRLEPVLEREYEFGHVVWGGEIRGRPAAIMGGRKGNRRLELITEAPGGGYAVELVDDAGGPSNIAVRCLPDRDLVLAANREIGEVALYEIRD